MSRQPILMLPILVLPVLADGVMMVVAKVLRAREKSGSLTLLEKEIV